MQQCAQSEIDVLRKEAVNVFEWVIYIRIGKRPKNEIIMLTLIPWHYISI